MLIGTGIVIEGFIKPNQPLAQLEGEVITTKDFQAFVRYQRFRLVNEYASTYQFIQNMGDPNSFSYFESYLLQLQNELQPEILGLNSIDQMVENIFVRKEAERLDIEVSPEEVQKMVSELLFQYYTEGTPTPAPTRMILPTPTLSSQQMTLVPPTPTSVVTETEELPISATEVVTEDLGTDQTVPTPNSPTPTAYTEDQYKKDYNEFMSYIRSFAKVSEDDIFSFYESILLRERVAEAIITDLPAEEERLWARHILFRDEENGEQLAKDFLGQIEAGEEFSVVAEEFSKAATEEESGVVYEDLGWFGSGDMVEPFDNAARELQIGEISQPVETSFGWHVIQLLGRDIQSLSQADIDQLRLEAFQEWLDQQRAEADLNLNPDWITLVPTEPEIPAQMLVTGPQ
jgi:parvulin-like peptidyl-prolyl isomerase